MKLYSSEIRWFSNEKYEILNIFKSFPGLSIKEKDRTDYYLPTENKDLGMKIRGGTCKLEMKWLVGKRMSYSIKGTEIGTIENWIKTGFESNDLVLKSPHKTKDPEKAWIKISKERQKKKYNILDNEVIPLHPFYKAYADCEVEFTDITINETTKYYTIGFESLREKEKSQKYLELTIEYLKDKLAGESINIENSFSYPSLILSYINEYRQ